jgi:hypothetical protein
VLPDPQHERLVAHNAVFRLPVGGKGLWVNEGRIRQFVGPAIAQ